MKAFLICPVRGVDAEAQMPHVKTIESLGYDLHWPPRDTDQNDETGLRICADNLNAIKNADVVFFVWDGKSQGCLFDLGMAFSLDKKIIPLDIPELTIGKSFQNMIAHYHKLNETT